MFNSLFPGPLEIVSPILSDNPNSGWISTVDGLWGLLTNRWAIDSNKSCGTHIHISPSTGWDNEQVKRIACAIMIYFKSTFEFLLPPHRRGNLYAKSNCINNPHFADMPIAQCIALITACPNKIEVVDLVNGDGSRYYSWNFLSLYHGRKSTIEFQQALGVTSATECRLWVEFIIAFAHAAISQAIPSELMKYLTTVGGLHQFINHLFQGANNASLSLIFTDKDTNGTLEPIPVCRLNSHQVTKFNAKQKVDANKNIVQKKIDQDDAKRHHLPTYTRITMACK